MARLIRIVLVVLAAVPGAGTIVVVALAIGLVALAVRRRSPTGS